MVEPAVQGRIQGKKSRRKKARSMVEKVSATMGANGTPNVIKARCRDGM